LIILDENILDGQRLLLQAWRLAARQIGLGMGRKGLKDEEIVVLLRRQRNSTFFTRDAGFYQPTLRHPSYGMVVRVSGNMKWLPSFAASYANFDTQAKRMGRVVRISHTGLRSGACGRKPRCTPPGAGPSSVGQHYGVRQAGCTAGSVIGTSQE
jgi:hypothetical protein